MKCDCNALEIITEDGKEHKEKLIELYNILIQRVFKYCLDCVIKPSPGWIWDDLSRIALTEGLANTPVLKFIEKKKISKIYKAEDLRAAARVGNLTSVCYIVDYGFDATSRHDSDWRDYLSYGTLVERMWKGLLKIAPDNDDLHEYLHLMINICKMDADIEFLRNKETATSYRGGIQTLKVILEERKTVLIDIVNKRREQADSKRMQGIL